MLRRFFLIYGVLLMGMATPCLAAMEDYPSVKLQGLDKSVGRTVTFEAKVGTTIQYGTLFIKIQACRKAPPIEKPESAAFLQIWEIPPGGDKSEWDFSGWMFASSPALSAMNHPVYDVWVLDCLGKQQPNDEAKAAETNKQADQTTLAPADPKAPATPTNMNPPPVSTTPDIPTPVTTPDISTMNASPSQDIPVDTEGDDTDATPQTVPAQPVTPPAQTIDNTPMPSPATGPEGFAIDGTAATPAPSPAIPAPTPMTGNPSASPAGKDPTTAYDFMKAPGTNAAPPNGPASNVYR